MPGMLQQQRRFTVEADQPLNKLKKHRVTVNLRALIHDQHMLMGPQLYLFARHTLSLTA